MRHWIVQWRPKISINSAGGKSTLLQFRGRLGISVAYVRLGGNSFGKVHNFHQEILYVKSRMIVYMVPYDYTCVVAQLDGEFFNLFTSRYTLFWSTLSSHSISSATCSCKSPARDIVSVRHLTITWYLQRNSSRGSRRFLLTKRLCACRCCVGNISHDSSVDTPSSSWCTQYVQVPTGSIDRYRSVYLWRTYTVRKYCNNHSAFP